jgi:hypothetical protein
LDKQVIHTTLKNGTEILISEVFREVLHTQGAISKIESKALVFFAFHNITNRVLHQLCNGLFEYFGRRRHFLRHPTGKENPDLNKNNISNELF